MKPLPASVHESKYQAAIRLLGLDNLESRERIRALESMEASHIIAKLGMAVPAAPMIDGDMCLVEPTFASLIGGIPKTLSRGWCSDIMLGYCQFDVSLHTSHG